MVTSVPVRPRRRVSIVMRQRYRPGAGPPERRLPGQAADWPARVSSRSCRR